MDHTCLLDSGALRTRMSAELAPLAGIELTEGLTERFYVGGTETVGTMACVNLTVTDRAVEFPGMRQSGSVIHGRTLSA